MSSSDWQEVIGVIGVFVLVITVVTVSIWQLAATWRAKAQLAREKEYRSIAEKAVGVQEETERRLGEIESRMQSLERILKEVE